MRAMTAVVLMVAVDGSCPAAVTLGSAAVGLPPEELEARVGQTVDLSPWGYVWRADRAVQPVPEACFVPRRLERLDRVYRTAYHQMPPQELKSIHYNQLDLLKPLPPPPRWPLQAALLWVGGLADYTVELTWPAEAAGRPRPEAVEVRVYPTAFGWFGWTVDRALSSPVVTDDGRVWTYRSEAGATMDTAYNGRIPAATEMVAVFYEAGPTGARLVLPDLRVTSPSLGAWQRLDVEIEWGFQPGMEGKDLAGRIETAMALAGPVVPLAGDRGTVATAPDAWRSRGGGAARRGIAVPVLYAPESRSGLDSRLTVWLEEGGFTVRLKDLAEGPLLIPGYGVCVARAGQVRGARQAAQDVASRNAKSIRQLTREHREAASWEEVMREVRLWTCPPGTVLAPFPPVEDPPMEVQLPDPGWTAAWRAAASQLRGKHMWGGLAFEVGRVAHEMDLIGLHDEADKVYQHFLASPGAKSDGDYSDGAGALEWAKDMRHDMGYSHDGTHASTGRLLFAMAERYFLTGDAGWFQRHRARLQAAADWIIRQRQTYMAGIPNRDRLFVAGLMPPCMLGDYALPACDWHWYYVDNALSLQGLQRFAEALDALDSGAARPYLEEAAAFRRDLCRAVGREAALAPVRRGRDGLGRGYIPRMAYARGLTGPELGAPQFPECDVFLGALPLAEPGAALSAADPRLVDTLDVMEELALSPAVVQEQAEARKGKGLSADDAWFWKSYVILPKASHNANVYLLQDDVPNFLRFWMNSYAAMVGADGRLWEHWHLGSYANCEAPDNGTAGWFMENFRNLLVMEEGDTLWLARATPRAWLEQGKRITVRNAPTHFGTVAYEVVSEVERGTITATVAIPARRPIGRVLLRLRHPQGSPIRSVTANGQAWSRFDPAREVIELAGGGATVAVTVRY